MKTKVMVISTVGLMYDGITSVILSYLKAMDLSNLDIYVAGTIKVEKNIRKQFEEIGCQVIDMPSRREKTLKYMLFLMNFIRKNKIKVVHAHGNSGTLAIEMVAAWLGGASKRIAHSHNTQCEQVKADKLLRPIFDLFYTDAIACGRDAGKWLFNKKKFSILKNGRDISLFSFDIEKRNNMRALYYIKDELVIGHVGGFVRQKNHRFLLEIYKEIVKKNSNVKLIMVGDGILKKEIEEAAAELKENIIFTGAIDNVSEILNMMDAMLLPSLFEGLPLVVIEWQINGLPCLISDTVTSECKLTDFLIFENLDANPSEWAEKILNMAMEDNRIENSKMGIESIRQAGFDITLNAKELKKIYLN